MYVTCSKLLLFVVIEEIKLSCSQLGVASAELSCQTSGCFAVAVRQDDGASVAQAIGLTAADAVCSANEYDRFRGV